MWILQFLRGRSGPNIHTRDWRAHCVRARVLGGCVCGGGGGGGKDIAKLFLTLF